MIDDGDDDCPGSKKKMTIAAASQQPTAIGRRNQNRLCEAGQLQWREWTFSPQKRRGEQPTSNRQVSAGAPGPGCLTLKYGLQTLDINYVGMVEFAPATDVIT